jgi:hypothetical protein
MSTEIIKNMPFDEYLSLNRLSSSALKDYYKSPAYFLWRKKNPMKESKALATGTMVHTWLLENHKFNSEYAIDPEYPKPEKPGDLRKVEKEVKEEYKRKLEAYENAVSAWEEANDGKVIIKREEIEKFKHLKPYNNTDNEVTVLFDFAGVQCKARFDVLHPNGVEDIKTIFDIFKVKSQFNSLAYFIQSGFYQIAFKEAFGKLPDFFNFTFISTGDFVAKETFSMEFDFMEISRDLACEYILKYKESLESGKFPLGISTKLETPYWL